MTIELRSKLQLVPDWKYLLKVTNLSCMIGRQYTLIILLLSCGGVSQAQECVCAEADKLRPAIGKYFNTGKLDSAAWVLNQLKSSSNDVCRIVHLDGIGQINISKKQYDTAGNF